MNPTDAHRLVNTPGYEEETPLSAWLKSKGMSTYKFAQLCPCNPDTAKNWAEGRRLPELISAFRIEKATGGEVPVASWLGTLLGRSAWEHGATDWKKIRYRNDHRDSAAPPDRVEKLRAYRREWAKKRRMSKRAQAAELHAQRAVHTAVLPGAHGSPTPGQAGEEEGSKTE